MKRLLFSFIVIGCCFLLVGCTQKESKKKESKSPEETEMGIEQEFSGEKTEVVEGSKEDKLLNLLANYGMELYNTKKYTSFRKKENMYFISLEELGSQYSYDISDFVGEDGTVCNKEESGVYFDPDNVLNLEYTEDFPPVLPALVGCSKDKTLDGSK